MNKYAMHGWFGAVLITCVAACATGGARPAEGEPAASATPPRDRPATGTPEADWSATMGWRIVTYREGGAPLSFQIEPMVSGADLVYVPDAENWQKRAPAVYRDRREEVLGRLKGMKWTRDLEWQDTAGGFARGTVVPGSLESTKGGGEFEAKNLFAPGSELTSEEARSLWIMLARRFAQGVRGKVTIFVEKRVPNSVFEKVELPTLRSNPNVTLDVRQVGAAQPDER